MHLKLGTQDFTELGEYGDMPELYSELRPCVSTYSRMTTYTYVTYIHVMYFTTYIYIYEWRTRILTTRNGHGQSGWSPIIRL